MKQKLLLLLTLLPAMILNNAKANEVEPNNTPATANTLALNGNNNGIINPTGDVDWWKVTTTGDGKLNITLTPLSGRTMYLDLYDHDGTTLITENTLSGTFTQSTDGLAAGTYYIRVLCYFGTDTSSYRISDALTVPSQANDVEPNNTRAQALTLGLNSSTTGHAGYYYNLTRDSSDWYKVTTNSDGRLRIRLTPVNGNYVVVALYDNDGTTLLNTANATSTFDVVKDGLATGTYYIKVNCYYTNQFSPYILADSLFTPAQANDKEPDDSKASADTLLLNSSTTGHLNYYYNVHRDTADWYKLTTNGDGTLRVSLTPVNGNYVWIHLYDNNGTTVINESNASGPFSVIANGLAAGTYYIKVNCFYSTDFAPYILSDSLFKPAQANDVEPNDMKAQAISLKVNGTKTGHVGYYYNNRRDTADWYKITTTADGLLRLKLTPAVANYVWVYLYDNNGTTLINSANNYTPFIVQQDGLAAGTYYVKINCYYTQDYAPYTLTDSLFTYTNAADIEPDDKPYLGKTMPANGVVTGHAGFYYNNRRDTTDWWKINYTGTGPLSVTLNLEPRKTLGYTYVWMEIWKDTLAAPIFSQNTISPPLVANFSSLTQGYYWVKVHCYFGSDFESYSLADTFTQVNIAAVRATTYDTAASCSPINSITFSCSNSSPPYSVKLYRYNALYATKTAKVKNVIFDSLPQGSYYAKAYGDGATGTAFGKSKNVNVVPIPGGLSTTGITATAATLNWTPVVCAKFDSIYYRVHGTNAWTKRNTTGNVSSYVLSGLTASTMYDWKIAAVDSSNGIIATGAFSAIMVFTTTTSPLANNDGENMIDAATGCSVSNAITVLPNPAGSYFVIQYKSSAHENVSATLMDVNGKAVWSSGVIESSSLNGQRVNTDRWAKGVFYLKILSEHGEFRATAKVVIAK